MKTMEIEIDETTVRARQKIAAELGISLECLLALSLEQLLLRIYGKMNNPFPENMFDAFTPQEEES